MCNKSKLCVTKKNILKLFLWSNYPSKDIIKNLKSRKKRKKYDVGSLREKKTNEVIEEDLSFKKIKKLRHSGEGILYPIPLGCSETP